MLWGGRFEGSIDPEMLRLTSSIDVDIELLEQDARVTKAHARVLVARKLLDASDLSVIDKACDAIVEEWHAGDLKPDPADEDVHSLVERELTERLGETGARIHAGRSRNDLVATDLRLWCRSRADELTAEVASVLDVITELADQHVDTVMPGYTHLQRAQPVSLAFHLLAHGFALARDAERFVAAARAADVSALGAGALAGNTLELDPQIAADELAFSGVFTNAMDAVSDRDFVADLLYACALCGVHLSRLAEEIVLWTSSEFSFARLDDKWSTGSSMMPQKRNPDLAELIRGRAGAGIGDLVGLLTLLKGLPLAYDRDLQEDKAYVFRSVGCTQGCLVGIGRLLPSLTFDKERLASAAEVGGGWATDLAERLVSRGVPFREAHTAAGRVVASLEQGGRSLSDLTAEELAPFNDSFVAADIEVSDPRSGMEARTSRGGTAPDRVREQTGHLRSIARGLREQRA
jgi:argininosuccinate lyase